ncbi:CAAD domain-containing protein [Roseofilum sp. BLCC_M154]|uniref:CAAD domain-containing protein n=1 Tax=Roseofilum acuticapitatum BLCC-M154 TaxID=3022444 RepID=A0ABT7APN5_9CYAN|nr:CAAD domain-containing protein [Roseofilum acuticapitatum]MDJ1168424.1 CAAD domain-containing protein [Roseofilum acuticapitatum BLCC-M154]
MQSKEPEKNPTPAPTPTPEPVSAPVPTPKAELVESPSASPVMASSSGQDTVNQVLTILSRLTDYIGEFFVTYQKPLVNVALVITALVAVYLTLAVLDAVNHIPLLGFVLAPLFELVGISYAVWFVWRYMLKASTRQELYKTISGLTSQVMGGQKADS